MTMTKSELRRVFLTKRLKLREGVAEAVSHQMRKPLMHLLCCDVTRFDKPKEFGKSACIHTFLPIEKKREVNTWEFVLYAWQTQKKVKIVSSVTNPATGTLAHYQIRPTTAFSKNRWGVPEPVEKKRDYVTSQQIDVVLIPLLAFDKQGHRVGYGGGYYDRFLAECRSDCLKIGLSLFEPVAQIDGIELTDVRLDACVTPDQTYFF